MKFLVCWVGDYDDGYAEFETIEGAAEFIKRSAAESECDFRARIYEIARELPYKLETNIIIQDK